MIGSTDPSKLSTDEIRGELAEMFAQACLRWHVRQQAQLSAEKEAEISGHERLEVSSETVLSVKTLQPSC